MSENHQEEILLSDLLLRPQESSWFQQIIPSSALGMGGKIAPSNRVVMGAIGTGSQGMSNMNDFLRLKNAVQFVAVCDVDSEQAFKSQGHC